MSWLGKRVRVRGIEFEGLVVGTLDFPGEPAFLKLVRSATCGPLPPAEPPVRSAMEYLPESELRSIDHPDPVEPLQTIVAYENAVIMVAETKAVAKPYDRAHACADCPVGGRDGPGPECPNAAACDRECAQQVESHEREQSEDVAEVDAAKPSPHWTSAGKAPSIDFGPTPVATAPPSNVFDRGDIFEVVIECLASLLSVGRSEPVDVDRLRRALEPLRATNTEGTR